MTAGAEHPAAGPLVTVVIVNWNGERLLTDCLDALAKQDLPDGQMAVWMVDNASADRSVELVERDFPWVRVIRNGRNDGFAGGNNVALREVTTPYVALLNSDARPEPDWLRNLLAPLRAGAEDGADPVPPARAPGTGDDETERAGAHGGAVAPRGPVPEADRIGATTSKVLFLPRFLPLTLRTPAFRPGGLDTRELGVRVYAVHTSGTDVTEEVLWDGLAYGPEGLGADRFRWTRPEGDLLVPVDPDADTSGRLALRVVADRVKAVELSWPGGSMTVQAGPEPTDLEIDVPLVPVPDPADTPGTRAPVPGPAVPDTAVPGTAGAPLVDVLNNVGSIVFADGYGADRAYQAVDTGRFAEPEQVFALCGAACAFRTDALREAGLFDDDFFLYYEDTDLSWRLQALGWGIRYEPTAVARHIHAASSTEWSPLFTFHVDRNRLLMLAKNAPAGLAAREALRYPLTTVSLFLRQAAASRHTRRRPPVRPTLLRLRVTASYLRLLPRMLARRRDLGRRARLGRADLQRWLVER